MLVEEGLKGSIRYSHFKAPGRRAHGKIVVERLGLGISRERFVVYSRSGRVKLIDTPFREPRLGALDVSLADDDAFAIRIDFDRAGVPKVSGQMTIRGKTPRAAEVVKELSARMGR